MQTISDILIFSSRWKNVWPKAFKIDLFLKQKYEIFRHFGGIFRHFFENFQKDIQAILRDICVKAYSAQSSPPISCFKFCYFITVRQIPRFDHWNPNAVLANRKIGCIYAVLANKIIICIYLCSCVFMRRFGRDLNPIRDG